MQHNILTVSSHFNVIGVWHVSGCEGPLTAAIAEQPPTVLGFEHLGTNSGARGVWRDAYTILSQQGDTEWSRTALELAEQATAIQPHPILTTVVKGLSPHGPAVYLLDAGPEDPEYNGVQKSIIAESLFAEGVRDLACLDALRAGGRLCLQVELQSNRERGALVARQALEAAAASRPTEQAQRTTIVCGREHVPYIAEALATVVSSDNVSTRFIGSTESDTTPANFSDSVSDVQVDQLVLSSMMTVHFGPALRRLGEDDFTRLSRLADLKHWAFRGLDHAGILSILQAVEQITVAEQPIATKKQQVAAMLALWVAGRVMDVALGG